MTEERQINHWVHAARASKRPSEAELASRRIGTQIRPAEATWTLPQSPKLGGHLPGAAHVGHACCRCAGRGRRIARYYFCVAARVIRLRTT